MAMWNQDDYLTAWNYASAIHQGQTLPGSNIPYINHLGLVAMEAMAAIAQDATLENPDLLVQCALLHDAIEDTTTTYADIERVFGKTVADGVMALTKNEALPKQEQMMDSLRRIKQQTKAVWMVKLCDRITNLQPPPPHWSREKADRYRNEALLIWAELGEASAFLAQRLKEKIEAYRAYT